MDPLLDDAPCGFASLADDGHLLLANRTLATMVGLDRGELVGRHVDRLLSAPGRIFYQTHVFPTLKLQGRLNEIYVSLLDARDREVPVLLNAARRERDGQAVSDWVVVPMRQRNEYENEILAARRAAEEAARAKDEFLAVASHELRSPLSAITGWAHLLEHGKLDAAAQLRGVRAIQQNAAMQAKLVDDLLDFGRVSAGKLRLDMAVTALEAVVSAALEGLLPTAQARKVALEAELQPGAHPVMGDFGRLRQVFWNIVANAVKFTPAAGRVRVVLRRDGPSVEVAVSDSGKGIAPEFLPYVFERFRQEDNAARREGGLGLGMAITRHLVELHGGTIAAASEGAGRGATFTVRLPLARASEQAAIAVDGEQRE